MPIGQILLFLYVVLVQSLALAVEIPRELSLGSSNFVSHSLGGVCYQMDANPEALPCNPAFVAKERRANFQTQFFFGNNISYIRDVSALLSGEGDQQTVQHLFDQRTSSEMEANVEAAYVREKFGIAYSPYRLVYYSLIRNQALPVMTLLAGQEQTIRVQVASYLQGDWFFGAQFRAVNRKFILSEFTLADALAEGGQSYFAQQTQNAFYFEPGLLYSQEHHEWQPQVSITVVNLGYVDEKYNEFAASPQVHAGGSIKPPVSLGTLELGVDAFLHSKSETWSEPWRLGVGYSLGMMKSLASISKNDHSFGFMLNYKDVKGGLTYWYRKYENILGETDQLRTVYLQFGFDI